MPFRDKVYTSNGHSYLLEGVVEGSVDIGDHECWIVEMFTGSFPVDEIRTVTHLQ